MKPRHAAALALVGWYLVYPCNTPAPYSGEIFCHNEAPEYWCYETLKNLGITNTSSHWNENEWKVIRRFDSETRVQDRTRDAWAIRQVYGERRSAP